MKELNLYTCEGTACLNPEEIRQVVTDSVGGGGVVHTHVVFISGR